MRPYFTLINLVGIYSLMVKISGHKSGVHRSTLHSSIAVIRAKNDTFRVIELFISKLSDSDVYTHSVFASVTLCMQIAIMPHLSFPVFLFNDICWAYLDVCLAGVLANYANSCESYAL